MPLAPKPGVGENPNSVNPPDLSDSQMKALREWWIWLYRMDHAGQQANQGDGGLYFFGKPTDPHTPPPEQWSWFFDPKAPWNNHQDRLNEQSRVYEQRRKEAEERGYPRALFPPDVHYPGTEHSPVMPADPGPPLNWQDLFGHGTPPPEGFRYQEPKAGQDGQAHPAVSKVSPAVATVAASLFAKIRPSGGPNQATL